MSVNFSLEDQTKGNLSIEIQNNQFILHYPCTNLTECTQYIGYFSPNYYLFELWGGEGGLNGGKGGYSRGKIHLYEPTILYLYIGSIGPSIKNQGKSSPPAYNGGGKGNALDEKKSCGSGGGATDIRAKGKTLFHRIIVAGGGGGANEYDSHHFGGAGGGIEGLQGSISDSSIAYGGNQTSPGYSKNLTSGKIFDEYAGTFGYGSNSTTDNTGSGGGGGWYGGASSPTFHVGGGGGSGYILTSTSFRPDHYEHNESTEFYFHYERTLNGTNFFQKCNSQLLEQGHSGHGCIRISILSNITCKIRKGFNISFVLLFVTILIKY